MVLRLDEYCAGGCCCCCWRAGGRLLFKSKFNDDDELLLLLLFPRVVDSNRSAKPPIALDVDRNGEVDDMLLLLLLLSTVAAVRLEANCRNALCPADAAGGAGYG